MTVHEDKGKEKDNFRETDGACSSSTFFKECLEEKREVELFSMQNSASTRVLNSTDFEAFIATPHIPNPLKGRATGDCEEKGNVSISINSGGAKEGVTYMTSNNAKNKGINSGGTNDVDSLNVN